jgi:hypothetical protein
MEFQMTDIDAIADKTHAATEKKTPAGYEV